MSYFCMMSFMLYFCMMSCSQNFNAHDVIGTFLMTLNGIHWWHSMVTDMIIKIFMYKLELTVEQTKCNIKINWLSVSVKTRTIWYELFYRYDCYKSHIVNIYKRQTLTIYPLRVDAVDIQPLHFFFLGRINWLPTWETSTAINIVSFCKNKNDLVWTLLQIWLL
jgi:hypothetical protein